MAHDYAKKTRSTPRKKPKTAARKPPANTGKAPVPGWVWLVVGCLVGAFVMFLVRLADVDIKAEEKPASVAQKPAAQKPATKDSKPQTTKPAQTAKVEPAKAPAEPEKPRFDFYHMLKENEVPVPKVDDSGAQAVAVQPKSYILQVASFRKAEDAEQLKVELILLNLEARAESVTVRNGEQWHRVLVGPFDSRSRLSKARSTLISNGHQALVMEHKPKS